MLLVLEFRNTHTLGNKCRFCMGALVVGRAPAPCKCCMYFGCNAGQRSGCVAIPLASFTGRLPAHVLEPSTRENPVPWAIPNGCDTRESAAKNCLSISPLAYRARGRPPFSAFGSCGALDTCVSQFSQMCVRALSFCRNHRPADVRLRLFPALACKWLR